MGLSTWQRFAAVLCTGTILLVVFKSLPQSRIRHSTNSNHDLSENYVSVSLDDIMTGEPTILAQNDPRIKKFIWDRGYLVEPSSEPYNLAHPNTDPSIGQGQTIRKLFKNMKGGFFIESGALDGETRSNSLYLEKYLGWKGLLIEPDPLNYAMLIKKNRKAYFSSACLATKPYPHKVMFQQNFNIGKITNDSPKLSLLRNQTQGGSIVVQCFPLYSLLNALNIFTVDYFSLDIEGTEMEVLETFPFDKIFIKTLSVEFNHIAKGKEGLKEFMEKKNYICVAEVTHKIWLANDFIFVHKSLHNLIAEAKKLIGSNTDAPAGSTIKLLATSLKYKTKS